jgi:SAM-dependent methyltransferase
LDSSPLSEAIDRIFETELPDRLGEPSLRGYYGDLREPELLEKYVRYHEDMLRYSGFDAREKDVLEVGSGFGIGLVWLASLGARAHGLEIVDWQLEDVRTYLARLPLGIRDFVFVQQGTASEMPYDDSRFDLLLAIEAVSHYLDYSRFLEEAHRVLRRGGKLLVVDGNNGLNPTVRLHCKHIWALHERDIVDDDDPWLFVPKRQRMIEESFPQIDEPDAHALALRTSGMVRGEVVEAVASYLQTGALPGSTYERGQLSVHPDYEMVMERLFNPFALAREIRAQGFRVQVEGYWGGASGSAVVRGANRVLATFSRLTMFSARSFRILAVKENGA